MNHLSVEDIARITDTSDLSSEYLTWYEGVEAHIADCALCREQIRRKILCDDLSDSRTLQTGILMLEKEEEIRRNMVIAKLMQQSVVNQSIINAMREQRYVQSTLTRRASHAIYRGVTEQEEIIYEQHGNILKVIFLGKQFRGMELENAKVILTDKSMKVEVEKPVLDENGHFTACFEGIQETDGLLVYVVEN